MSRITIYTIAKAAGVSAATVSKVLNNQSGVSQETSVHVMEIIKEMNFIPQQRKQLENSIGFVSFMTNNRPLTEPFDVLLLNGICQEAGIIDKNVTLIDGEKFTHLTPEELHWYPKSNSIMGFLGVNLAYESDFGKNLNDAQIPFIQIANSTDNSSYVISNNYEATSELIDYILCMGHRNVAFIGVVMDMIFSHKQRFKAYEDTMKKHNVSVRKDLIENLPDMEAVTVRNAVAKLMARPQPPTAIFLSSEGLVTAIPALFQMGYRIPDDVSVAGMAIDNTLGVLPMDLSSIIQPADGMGRMGVKCLLKLIETGEKQTVTLDSQVRYGNTIRKISSEQR